MHEAPQPTPETLRDEAATAPWERPEVKRIRAGDAEGNGGAGFDFASEAS